MAKNSKQPKDAGQDELKKLLSSDSPEIAVKPKSAESEAKPEEPADFPPPDPRAIGTITKKAEEKDDNIVAEIEAENAHSALDDMYENEREPESPLLIVGDKKRHWYHFLKRPKFWVTLVGLLLAGGTIAWLITPSRVWFLNTVGMRTEFEVTTLVSAAEGTPPPLLKNALVTINGREYRTNDEGNLKVSIPYGQTRVVINKPGYETVTKDQLFDFDPFFYYLGGRQTDEQQRKQSVVMKSVGIEVKFTAKDWLTGQPITTGHFGVGDVVTTPGAQGEVVLLIPATDAKTVQLTGKFGSSGYADMTQEITLAAVPAEINFVPAGKHYFVSKRSGQFVVYSSNLDGSSVTEIVAGSPRETGDIAFSVSPNGRYAAFASTREATRDTFGTVQQKLYIVDLAGTTLTAVDTALQFDFADWSGDNVVYVAHYREAGGASVQRVASVDTDKQKRTTLASDTGLKVVRVRLSNVVYLTSAGELRTNKVAGGSDKSLGSGAQKFTQTEPDKFAYQIADKSWRQYDVNADQVSTISTPNPLNRAFLASASGDGQTLLVVEVIDGKLTLIARAVGNGQQKQLYAGQDLRGPIRWVGTVAVYRAGEADYAVGAIGGTPKKITDVSATQTSQNDYFDFN